MNQFYRLKKKLGFWDILAPDLAIIGNISQHSQLKMPLIQLTW